MPFRFRQFGVEDRHSTMRVGTDAMLLGSWAEPRRATRILDAGTGCGVLALMLAQRSGAAIDAIDIDADSVTEAETNFNNSPWPDRLTAFQRSLNEHALLNEGVYDFIISNPPFFSGSLLSPGERKNRTRHTLTLPPGELIRDCERLLTLQGALAVVLPWQQAKEFTGECLNRGLFLHRMLEVTGRPGKTPVRALMEFTRDRVNGPPVSSLCIRDNDGSYSGEYLRMTASFHHF